MNIQIIPSSEVPSRSPHRGTYSALYQQIDELQDGQSLHLTFDSDDEFRKTRVSVLGYIKREELFIKVQTRGRELYITRK